MCEIRHINANENRLSCRSFLPRLPPVANDGFFLRNAVRRCVRRHGLSWHRSTGTSERANPGLTSRSAGLGHRFIRREGTLCVGRRAGHSVHTERTRDTMAAMVVDPFPRSGNPLACRDHGGVADCREVTMPARLGPQNTKAVIAVVERDALDEAGQHFLSCRFRLVLRRSAHDVPSSVAVNNSLMVANWASPRRSDRHSIPSGRRSRSRAWPT